MSKTLSIKTINAAVKTLDAQTVPTPTKEEGEAFVKQFTADQLRAMLREIGEAEYGGADQTMDLPTGVIPAHLIADKSNLPPVGERAVASIQPPAKLHGCFDINGIPVIAPGVSAGPIPFNVDPASGRILAQITPPRVGGQISPPPSRNFK
jgi:hypothetical protein